MANRPLLRVTVMCELLDVVDEAEELPLRLDLLPATERESIEPLVVADVAEDRLHRGEALAVACTTGGRIDSFLHSVGV